MYRFCYCTHLFPVISKPWISGVIPWTQTTEVLPERKDARVARLYHHSTQGHQRILMESVDGLESDPNEIANVHPAAVQLRFDGREQLLGVIVVQEQNDNSEKAIREAFNINFCKHIKERNIYLYSDLQFLFFRDLTYLLKLIQYMENQYIKFYKFYSIIFLEYP